VIGSEVIRKRRSIRNFTNRRVEQKVIDRIIDYFSLAPSSRGIYPTRVFYTTDRDKIIKLSKSKAHGSQFLEGAPLVFIVGADASLSDVWIEDASIVATYILLAVEDLGLGATWVQIRKRYDSTGKNSEDFVKDALGVNDENLRILCLIGIGYKAEEKPPGDGAEIRKNVFRI